MENIINWLKENLSDERFRHSIATAEMAEKLNSLDFEDENVLVLEPCSAHYTVYGLFTDNGNVVYEMEYKFDVEQGKITLKMDLNMYSLKLL